VILYFLDAVGSKAVLRLSLDHLNDQLTYKRSYSVDKVGGSGGPPVGNIVLSDLDLLLENVIANFFP